LGVGVVVCGGGRSSGSAKFLKLKLDGVIVIKPSSFSIYDAESVLLFKAGLVEESTRILKLINHERSITQTVSIGTSNTQAFIE
jgi:hypothetical protein